jgi:hypothetical protein
MCLPRFAITLGANCFATVAEVQDTSVVCTCTIPVLQKKAFAFGCVCGGMPWLRRRSKNGTGLQGQLSLHCSTGGGSSCGIVTLAV